MLEYIGFRIATALFAVIPFRVLYLLADAVAFVLSRIVRYRRAVVFRNLEKSFPEKSPKEIAGLAARFYLHLADILLESLKGLSMGEAEIKKRYHYSNPEILDADWEAGKSVILMPAHYGNWEWGVLSLPLPLKHGIVGIYKPLKNPKVEAFAAARRTRFGLQLCPITETRTALDKTWNPPVGFIFMSDQSPSNSRKAHWLTFLHQDTACLQGADIWARKLNMPVYFMDIQRQKRGFYDIRFTCLSDQPATTEVEAITRAYFQQLEMTIRRKPEDWLWSHKRWKKKRTNF
ncbi:MAG: lysophospholipid acyltransferase family protein [Saprospiraceae bacterium]|nr:lysophospholipid acyltransferase family protein [Saprospiraceae bacterium]